MDRAVATSLHARRRLTVLACAALLLVLPTSGEARKKKRFRTPTRSSTIRITKNDKLVVAVNREANSLAVLQVRKGDRDVFAKLAEVPVGVAPRFVAVDPAGKLAFVTNGASGTVSVVSLAGDTRFTVIGEIPVGDEPRGCTITPNGTRLFVANHTDGTVSVIDTASRTVVQTVALGGHPTAIAVTNDLDKDDGDETVFVTEFFSELIPGKQEPFDDARQGVVHAFPSGALAPVTKITLSPLATSGFTADRSKFCNLTTEPDPASQVYCPDTSVSDPADPRIAMDPQGAFPNLLGSAVIRGTSLYLPNIGAAPEPPVKFNVNVQALVHVVDTASLTEQAARHVNLNAEVKAETAPADPTASLDRLFGNELAAIDADLDGTLFLVVSRGGNFACRAALDGSGRLPLDAFLAKHDPVDQRISNWSAVRGSVTDFNNNSRAVQGGKGFAGDPPNPNIYNHGITQGASDALDLMTLWVQTVRTLNEPQPADVTAGRTVFGANCASCHGGPKWSKSQTIYADNPAFTADPLGMVPGVPRDPGVTALGGGRLPRRDRGRSVSMRRGAAPPRPGRDPRRSSYGSSAARCRRPARRPATKAALVTSVTAPKAAPTSADSTPPSGRGATPCQKSRETGHASNATTTVMSARQSIM